MLCKITNQSYNDVAINISCGKAKSKEGVV